MRNKKDSVRKQDAKWRAATPTAIVVTPTPHEDMPGIAHPSNHQKAIDRKLAEKERLREIVRATLAAEIEEHTTNNT